MCGGVARVCMRVWGAGVGGDRRGGDRCVWGGQVGGAGHTAGSRHSRVQTPPTQRPTCNPSPPQMRAHACTHSLPPSPYPCPRPSTRLPARPPTRKQARTQAHVHCLSSPLPFCCCRLQSRVSQMTVRRWHSPSRGTTCRWGQYRVPQMTSALQAGAVQFPYRKSEYRVPEKDSTSVLHVGQYIVHQTKVYQYYMSGQMTVHV